MRLLSCETKNDLDVFSNYPGIPSARGLTDSPSDALLGDCEQYDPVSSLLSALV